MRFLGHLLKAPTITVALSMGVDSLAVLHFLKTRYPRKDIRAVHFNHNLRSQNFTMEFAAIKFCAAHKVPLAVMRRDRYTQTGTSESELRKYRLNAFRDRGLIVTGHHLGDACESYLLNCFNGTPEYLPIPLLSTFEDQGFSIAHPFLLTSKADMVEYVESNNLKEWLVVDETNSDEKYRRNWVRNTIIPQISQKNYNLETIIRKKYLIAPHVRS